MPKKAFKGFSNILEIGRDAASDSGKVTTSKRQKRKHEILRGTEFREVRIRGKDIYTGMTPIIFPEGEGKSRTRMLGFEGLTEGDFWSVVNFTERNLQSAVAQPTKLPIEMFGEKRHWIPDGQLEFKDGRKRLVEIKGLKAVAVDADADPFKARWVAEWLRAIEAAAHARGCEFALYTDADIRKEPRFYNAKMLARAQGSQIPDEALRVARVALGTLPSETTIRDLSEKIGSFRTSALMIACLLDRAGVIQIDRRNPFRADSDFTVLETPEPTSYAPVPTRRPSPAPSFEVVLS